MANTFLTPTEIAREGLFILENELTFVKFINRKYTNEFARDGAKIGDSVRIRKPARYTVSTGAALSTQDVTETYVTLQITDQAHIDTTFTSEELALDVQQFSARVLQPKVAGLANYIDYTALSMYNAVYNHVGTPGTTPATAAAILAGGQRLNEMAAPQSMRSMVVDPAANASLVDGLKGLFHTGSRITDNYNTGNMGPAFGFKFSMDQNIRRHTWGPRGGTPAVNGAPALGATTLVTDGWTASAAQRVAKGDVFTVLNSGVAVQSVNPQSRQATGQPAQFVCTADGSSDGSGNLTLSISPGIYASGPLQNINTAILDNATLSFSGTASTAYPQNLAFHRDAFTVACVDLIDPSGMGVWAARENHKDMSMRILRQYRVGTDDVATRIDVLFGYLAMYPELACRVTG